MILYFSIQNILCPNVKSLPSTLFCYDPLGLQAERQAEDRRHKKLMERFGELSSEFREACALLFGFGLYVRQSGVYKVVPLHAPFDAENHVKSSKATEFIKFRVSNGLNLLW